MLIDWLTLYQKGDFPRFGSELVVHSDLDTGEITKEWVTRHVVKGSFDTSLTIRSDGTGLEVSGNPSRFARKDNVFGFSKVSDCIALYNSVLRSLGLPEFSDNPSTNTGHAFQYQRGSGAVMPDYSVVIRRIDITQNYVTGSMDDSLAFVRYLGQLQHQGKKPLVFPTGVSWGSGSRYTKFKYYLKGPEFRQHKSAKDMCAYSKRLADWLDTSGLIRFEVRFGSTFLRRHGLHRPEKWGFQEMSDLLDKYQPHKKMGVNLSSYQEIRRDLIEAGLPKNRAERAQQAAFAWLNGHEFIPGQTMSKSAFYRLRSDLRMVGIDIGQPCDVSALPLRIREVTLQPAIAPAWYRSAGYVRTP